MTDWNTNNKVLTITIVWQPESAEIYACCSPFPLGSM